MATELLLVREKGHLCSADPYSHELIGEIAQGEVVAAKITRKRNLKHHRMFFALVGAVYDVQERYPTTQHLLDALKIAIGHYDLVQIAKGKTVIKTRSISFEKMDQTAFNQFYKHCVDKIVSEVLPGVNSDDLYRRVDEILGVAV